MTISTLPTEIDMPSAYRDAVLASSPTAYWPLSDPVGSIAVGELVANLSGLVHGGVTFTTPDPWQKPAAAYFDGSTGFIVDMLSRDFDPEAWSIEVWYRTAVGPATLMEFNAGQDALVGSYTPSLFVGATGNLSVFAYGGSVGQIADDADTRDGAWHHVVATLDGPNLILYRDAVAVAQTDQAAPLELIGYWHIGNGLHAGWLTGNLCHVAVYLHALSPDDVLAHYSAGQAPAPPVVPADFDRKAWLVLDELSVPLDNLDGGWLCTQLDLGSPDVREVTNNRPDAHGLDDRTRFLGGRVVTADMIAFPNSQNPLDAIVSRFAPFMNPSLRPELHFTLMDGTQRERMVRLRANGFAAAMPQPISRVFQLSWVAADPLVYDAVVQTVIAWSGSSTPSGRVYDLVHDRTYPLGAGGPIPATIVNGGDAAIAPLLRLFGPITDPRIYLQGTLDRTQWSVTFQHGFRVDAGRYIDIDCARHTATADDGTNSLGQLYWPGSVLWPAVAVGDSGQLQLMGTSTTGTTQVQAIWQDRYLT